MHVLSRYARPGGASGGYFVAWGTGAAVSLAVIVSEAVGHLPRGVPPFVALGEACLRAAGSFAPGLLSPDQAALLLVLAFVTGVAVRAAEPLVLRGYTAIVSAGMWITGRAMVWHYGFAFLGWLASVCLRPAAWDRGWVSALLAINAVAGIVIASVELAKPYGSGEAAARQIVARGLEGERWAALPSWAGAVAAAVLERPFFCLEDETWHATVIPPAPANELEPAQVVERLSRFVGVDARPAYALVAESWLEWLPASMRAAGYHVDELGVMRGFSHENIGVLRLQPVPRNGDALTTP